MNVRNSRCGFTVIELLISIAVIGILLALILPAVQSARASARATVCKNNLKQIVLAGNNFESVHRHYPGNGWGYLWIGDPNRGVGPRQPGGWIYQLLPFVEQEPLAEIGNGLEGAAKIQALGDLTQSHVKIFDCPERPEGRLGPFNPALAPMNAAYRDNVFKTDYAINEGDWISDTRHGPSNLFAGDQPDYPWKDLRNATGISFQRSQVSHGGVRDGASNTYFAGEKYVSFSGYGTYDDLGHDQPCFSGVDLDINRWTIQPPLKDSASIAVRRFGSAHRDGCHMAFCDGAVKMISYEIDPQTHRYLGNRRDGEVVEVP